MHLNKLEAHKWRGKKSNQKDEHRKRRNWKKDKILKTEKKKKFCTKLDSQLIYPRRENQYTVRNKLIWNERHNI